MLGITEVQKKNKMKTKGKSYKTREIEKWGLEKTHSLNYYQVIIEIWYKIISHLNYVSGALQIWNGFFKCIKWNLCLIYLTGINIVKRVFHAL